MPGHRGKTGAGMLRMNVWTIETVHDRCTDDGDCWLWAQAVNSAGHPQASIPGVRSKLIRRFAFEAMHGLLDAGTVVADLCQHRLCCNPEHLQQQTMSQVLKLAYASGARNRHHKRPNFPTKLDWMKVAEIRSESVLTRKQMAEKYGVSTSAIKEVILYRTWKEKGSSVFTWRKAA